MVKIIAYPLTLLYLLFFGLALLIFHPIQWFCFTVFGYNAHKTSVDYLQFCLIKCLHILGTRFTFNNNFEIDANTPLIIVANHQSMNDIPPILWYLRKHHPKFISKKELGKGVPSVSYNLRHGGSVIIDRKKPIESIQAIKDFAERVKTNNWSAVIFPEGTRSRNGKPRPFKTKGLITLIDHIPNATIIPLTINNSWKTLRYGKFPMGLGSHIKFEVHQPLKISDFPLDDLLKKIENDITQSIIHD